MKRSEMIQIMVEELRKNWIETDEEQVSAMEHVLGKIEEAGMLPPTRTERSVLPGLSDFKINKWEPEDDAK